MPERDDDVVDALAYLTRLVDHEISSVGISAGNVDGLTLEPTTRVLDALGRPDQSYRIVHITGTNGKGSVARMVEALIATTGLRPGSYLSPEGTVNERIRIDGHPIDDASLADAVSSVRGVAGHLDVSLTAFEAVTLSALVAFADAPVDVAVVEVGLLGRYDATNVVDGDVAVVTSVGGDHTDFAPGWRDRVAGEKAGILKAASQAVLGDLDDDLIGHFTAEGPESLVRLDHDFAVVDDRVALGGRRAEITTSRGSRFEVFIPLHGSHQATNAAIAIEATESVLHGQLSAEVVDTAFASLSVPGRVELVRSEPVVIVDGAHNADAAAAVGATLSESFVTAGRRTAVLGMLAGRPPQRFIEALNDAFPLDLVVACTTPGPRGVASSEIAEAARQLGLAVVEADSVAAGVTRAIDVGDEGDLILVTGSFRVVDEARAAAVRR
ncbi:MAG: Mur ligase family protein [Acidimicrobiales bacterium]